MIIRGSAIVLALLMPALAHADSDGYFCVGAGYMAVEFRSFNTKSLAASHVLKIARFDQNGPRWAGELVLEDFQTHTIACGAATILIEGAGERGRGLVSYLIVIDSAGAPAILRHTSNPEHRFDSFPPEPENIGVWAQEGIRHLPDRGGYPQYRLRVTRSSQRRNGAIYHLMTSALEEVDAGGGILRALTISKGTRVETVN
jgi:hypothetical protein